TRYWVALESDIASASNRAVALNQAYGSYLAGGAHIGAAALNWTTALSSGAVVVDATRIDLTKQSFVLPGSTLVSPATGGSAASADGNASVSFAPGTAPTSIAVSVAPA